MRQWRLQWQIYLPALAAVLFALVAMFVYTAIRIRTFDRQAVRHELLAQAGLLQYQVSPLLKAKDFGGIERLCRSFKRRIETRITVILPSGLVVGDNEHDPHTMENHSDRPEVIQAMKGMSGYSVRFSFTLQRKMMYTAIPIMGSRNTVIGILRTSRALSQVNAEIVSLYRNILLASLFIAILTGLASFLIARRITRPLNEISGQAQRLAKGDFSARVPVPDTLELSVVAGTMNDMADQIRDKISQIEDQKKMMEAAFSGMREGVMVLDHQGNIINFNQPLAAILNLGNVRNEKVFEAVRNPKLLSMLNRVLDRGNDQESEIVLDMDSGKRILQVYARPIKGAGDITGGAVMVLSDVTHLHRLETIRKDFVANVSHELRTPITAIQGFVETLLSGQVEDRETLRQFLEIISRHVVRMNAIIGDLLTLSRVEASEGNIERDLQPLVPVIYEAIYDHSIEAEKKRVTIEVDCPSDLQADFNFNLLEQAIANLVDNAVRYSPEGTPVKVSAHRDTQGVVISVIDQGPGIPSHHLPRLFERFYRVDKARSRMQGSTGLGLSIVRHIAMVHQGRVSVSSTVGKGSEFRIILS